MALQTWYAILDTMSVCRDCSVVGPESSTKKKLPPGADPRQFIDRKRWTNAGWVPWRAPEPGDITPADLILRIPGAVADAIQAARGTNPELDRILTAFGRHTVVPIADPRLGDFLRSIQATVPSLTDEIIAQILVP